MAHSHRPTTNAIALLEALAANPHGHDFFHALRRLECVYPDHPRLGESVQAKDDPVRLGQTPSLAFAPSTLSECQPGADGAAHRLSVLFLGLLGPNGPLPLHLTEYARDRLRNEDDPTFARFLDVFHHRMLSLFYRAWANTQPTVHYDRPRRDQFAGYVASQVGLGFSSLRERDAMPDLAKLYYAGHLACHLRHAEGLASIVEDFFAVRATLLELVGEWLAIRSSDRWHLGRAADVSRLGQATTLGKRVWQCQHRFRLKLGPMSLSVFLKFLPGKRPLEQLAAVVKNYAGLEYTWDLNLVLRYEQVPAMRLGTQGRLGWTSWLGKRRTQRDADDLVLSASLLRKL